MTEIVPESTVVNIVNLVWSVNEFEFVSLAVLAKFGVKERVGGGREGPRDAGFGEEFGGVPF